MREIGLRNDSARIDIETATAELAAAELKVESLAIRAPFDGAIVTCAGSPGEFVAKAERPLMELIGGPYQIEAALPDRLAPGLKPGQIIEFDMDKEFSDKTFKGTIAIVSPVLDPRCRSVKVQISLPPEALTVVRPGLVVNLRVPLRMDH
jgi:multidrug resistance efflux pump